MCRYNWNMSENERRRDAYPDRHKRPRRVDVRRKLLKAALEEFSRFGYDKASLDEVAAIAGFSKGAIYSNFTNKEGLFLALMDEQIRDRIKAVESACKDLVRMDEGDASAGRVGHQIVKAIAADEAFQLLYLEYVTHVARVSKAREELADRRRVVRTLIADAARTVLGSDHQIWEQTTPEILTIAILALSNGVAIERIATPEDISKDMLAKLISMMIP